MKNDLTTITKSLVAALAQYIGDRTKVKTVIGKGNVEETAIETAFMLYDDRQLTMRVRQEGKRFILHDNGTTNQYLQSYGLNLLSKKVPLKYLRWLKELMRRNDLHLNKDFQWFSIDLSEKGPEKKKGAVGRFMSLWVVLEERCAQDRGEYQGHDDREQHCRDEGHRELAVDDSG